MDLTQKAWSYSSLKLYETCPYAFYLKYIEEVEEQPNAFAQHGKFTHAILERYFRGELYAFELADVCEAEYADNVTERFPFYNMAKSFYDKTLAYLQSFDGIDGEVIGIEQQLESVIGGYKFIGFADLILRDETGIVIVDHKSKGSWKSKKERADYMRQMYLYSHCVKEIYGEFPYKLVFNKFRAEQPLDEEKFNEEDYKATIDWFSETIAKILSTDTWDCQLDSFYCSSLCGLGCIWGE